MKAASASMPPATAPAAGGGPDVAAAPRQPTPGVQTEAFAFGGGDVEPATEAFAMADDVLYQGVKGVTDLMVRPGLINLDFADVRSVMDEMGKAMMGTGEATGDDRALLAAQLEGQAVQARASLRATVPDQLPVVGQIPDQPGLMVLGALGSRGFTLAPLLADHLVAITLGRPSPLPRTVIKALEPGRFAERQRRRS